MLHLESTLDHRILSEIDIRGSNTGRKNPDARERRFKLYWNPVDVRPLNTPMKSYDRFCARLSSAFDDTGLRSEPYALLIGNLLGDGCYTGCSESIALRCFDPSQIVALTEMYGPLGFKFTENTANKGTYIVAEQKPREVIYREDGSWYRNRIKEWLKVRDMWGKYSYEKTLPPDIHSWDNASVAAFVSGYLATDGHIAKTNSTSHVVGFGSTSKKLLKQLRRLLQIRFGVRCTSISQSTKKGQQVDGEPYRPCYKFSIASFNSLCRLQAVLKIPGVKQRRFEKRMKHRRKNNQQACYELRARRTETKSIGMKHTYDLYVAHPDHLFVLANGLVVHNSQVALSSKHGGGVAGSNKLLTGMPLFKALINTPKTLKGGAAHATVDGKVERIEDAPAGGQYVYIGGKRHYVSAGFGLHIKPGDTVEAGDVISEGIPNPAMVVQYKGVGEGRRYFTKLFGDALKNADIYTHRRNVELMARGLINHVELTDEVGEGIPGDIVPYQALESTWQPRAETRKLPVKAAVGKYLERPVLHYTIGTQVRPSVQKELEEFGISDVDVHDDPPPFTSTLVRADTQLQHDPDVITRMYGSHIRKSFLGAVHRGGSSDRAGTSFVPGLAYGLGFGTYGKVRTPKHAPPHPGWSTGEPLQTEVEMPQKKAARICPGCPTCPKCGSDETVPDREDGKILCYACDHVFKGRDKSAAVKPTLAHTFDRPKGTKKTFETPDGKREVTYPVDYGYFDDIFNPEDGEEADVFVGNGDLCGRFMKGDNLSGEWKPDERKWYIGLTPEEFRGVMDMYRNDGESGELPSLIRDHVRFDDVRHLEDDVKLLPQRDLAKAANLAAILPIIALLGTLGIQNLPALLQFFGIKNPFAGNNTGIAKGSPAAPPAPSPPVSSAGGDGGWLGSLGKDVSLRGMFNTAMGGVGTVAGGLGTLATAVPGTLAAGGQGLANMVGMGNTVRPYLDVPRNLNREMATATGNAYAQAAGGMTRGNTDFNQYMNGTLDNAANMAQAPNASMFDRAASPIAERANALSQTATAAALARGAAPVMPGWMQSVTNAVTNPFGVAMSQAAPSSAVQSIPALKPYIGENALRQQGDQLRTLGQRMGASWLGNAAGAVYETAVPAAIDYGIFRGAAGLTGGARNAVSRGLGAAADYNKGMLTPSMGAVTGTLGAVAGTPAPLPTPRMPSISKPPDGHAPIQRARSAVPGF
jgi:transcription initiation factor TFIIIB Brf1 subunit/transcription initiation factor TFIIB